MAKLRITESFGVIPNSVLNDERLSFKAKGIYGFIQSKPDGWEFSAERMMANTKDGRDSIREGLKELDACGYLVRKTFKNDFGQFEHEYELKSTADFPMTENPSSDNPTSENPTSENPSCNKERNSKKELIKKETVSIAKNEFSQPLKKERDQFFESLEQGDFTSLYGKFGNVPDDTVRIEARKFLMYWTETDMRGKPRWKKQTTFEPIRRFATWIYKTCEKIEEKKPKRIIV